MRNILRILRKCFSYPYKLLFGSLYEGERYVVWLLAILSFIGGWLRGCQVGIHKMGLSKEQLFGFVLYRLLASLVGILIWSLMFHFFNWIYHSITGKTKGTISKQPTRETHGYSIEVWEFNKKEILEALEAGNFIENDWALSELRKFSLQVSEAKEILEKRQ